MGKLFRLFLNLVEKATGRKIIYYTPGEHNSYGKTAVKSALGFWYAGNVLDITDIAYGILNHGQIEAEETTLVSGIFNIFISQGSFTFYDIGANTGYYGILAGFLGKGKATTYSFEPVKQYRDCLKDNVYLNRLENNFKIFDVALSNEEGAKVFYLAGSGSSLSSDFLDGQYENTQTVITTKLDTIIAKENLLPPDFVKIDVEGNELPVLLGGKLSIEKHLPVLFIEIAYSLKSAGRNFVNKNFDETFNLLINLGYQTYSLKGNKVEKYAPSHKADGVAMYLFLNSNKHAQILNKLKL